MFQNASLVSVSPVAVPPFRECIPSNNCLGEERTFKIVSPALVIISINFKVVTH